MKRLATKIMLAPTKLTAEEKRFVFQVQTVPRLLKYLNYCIDKCFWTRGLGDNEEEWRKIMKKIFNKFRTRITQEDSLSLGYQALRASILKNRHYNFGYFYRACENHHNDFVKAEAKYASNLRKLRKSGRVCQLAFRPDWESVDFTLDLEAALERAMLGPLDRTICRLRLLEQLTFAEIGASTGMSSMGVLKRFRNCWPFLNQLMFDYGCSDVLRAGELRQGSVLLVG